MNKIALYPINKITYGLLRFRDLLKYEVKSIIDFTFEEDEFNILNLDISEIIVTNDISKGLENIDTLILNDPGVPLENFREFYEKNDLMNKWCNLIEYANQSGIKVIMTHFRPNEKLAKIIAERNLKIEMHYEPRIKSLEMINRYKEVAAPKINKIGIFGVGPVSGKYTAQMTLYREMLKANKSVTSIITEPVGFLYGLLQPPVNFELNYTDYARYIEVLIKRCAEDGYKNVIMAGQYGLSSGCKTDNYYLDLNFLALTYLRGFMPDYVILAVGYDDDDIIDKCISNLKTFAGIEYPIAFVLPDRIEKSYCNYQKKTLEEIRKRKEELKNKYKVVSVETVEDIGKLIGIISR